MSKKYQFVALAVSVLLTLSAMAYLRFRPEQSMAPAVSLLTITGQTIQLSELKGKPVIITFWATDCAVCVKEIPDLTDLHHAYHAQGLAIIAIAMYYDPPNHVLEMSRAKQIPYNLALDLRAEHARAFGDVRLTPTTFVINPDGLIVKRITGAFNTKELNRLIKTLLKG